MVTGTKGVSGTVQELLQVGENFQANENIVRCEACGSTNIGMLSEGLNKVAMVCENGHEILKEVKAIQYTFE